MVEEKVESNDKSEIEHNVTVSETSQLSGKKTGEKTGQKQGNNQVKTGQKQGTKQGKKQGKEQDDTIVEPTYTCPICKEYSNNKFASVYGHSLTKHGKH